MIRIDSPSAQNERLAALGDVMALDLPVLRARPAELGHRKAERTAEDTAAVDTGDRFCAPPNFTCTIEAVNALGASPASNMFTVPFEDGC